MVAIRGNWKLLVAGVVLILSAAGGVYLWLNARRPLDPAVAAATARAAADSLDSTAAVVSIDISYREADREVQEFSAGGSVDFEEDRSALTYDFEELINAAGVFGHLDDFKVVLDGGDVYVQIFREGASWVSFTPTEVAGLDVERLREVLLSSPLVLPDYLDAVREVTGYEEAGTRVVRGVVVPSILDEGGDLATNELHELLDQIGVEVVTIETEVRDGQPQWVDYEFRFPIVEASEDDAVTRVRVSFEPRAIDEISPPSSEETRRLEEFLDR